MGSVRRVLAVYGVWIVLLIFIYYAVSGLRTEAWGLLCISGIGAVGAGVRLHRPARVLPWLLLAAALACFASGQMSFLIAQDRGTRLPYPSYADALYLACYPLYAAGLYFFVRQRTPHGDRRSLVDGLTLTAGLALLSWVFLIHPYVIQPGVPGLQRAVSVAYPLGDILMLATLVRLLAPGTWGTRCMQLLTAGGVSCLASDTVYTVIELHGVFHNGSVIDLGWALFYSAWGAAALHPSMTRLTEPAPAQQATVSPARLALIMLAALVAPAVTVTALPGGPTQDETVTAVCSAVMYLLVLSRLWDAAASNRRALDRERTLRQAGLSLVTAADAHQVALAVQDAVRALPGGVCGDALVGVLQDGTLQPEGRSGDGDDRLARLAWQQLPGPDRAAGPVFVPVAGLSALAAAARPAAAWALLCPLGPGTGREPVGMIAVFGAQRALVGLAAALEILAHQAALTLQGITLRQEVIRQRSEAYFRSVVQDASDAIVIADSNGRVKYATPSSAAVFGQVPSPGSRLQDLATDEDGEAFAGALDGRGQGPRTAKQRITRRDGRVVHVQVRCSDLRDDPSVAGLVLTLRDVTEQHELEEQLRHGALHDALTGLPNRVLFQDRIGRQLAAGGSEATAGVLFIDLDDFKLVNDTLGHAAGDDLLVAVAARLAALVRDSDTAARLGGDEFALLVGYAPDDMAVEAAAARVVAAFDQPFVVDGIPVSASATVGVATTADSADTSELLRHADLALYAAKAAGKRQWRRYRAAFGADVTRRREMTEALGEAARTSAFDLAYQPIASLDGGELTGFEALIRWPHPQWGMMHPGQFIGLAEETGQVIPVGAWVLSQAAAALARWQDPGPDGSPPPRPGLYVSVNVSGRQFAEPGFAGTVRRALDDSGLDPGALVLEITETALLPAIGTLDADLAALRASGVRLAIDDFGTGWCSMAYLQRFPVDLLKMDGSFVSGIEDSHQRALAESIVHLAAGIDCEVIAEGIETESQQEILVSMGCRYGQGYLIGRPMPAAAAEHLTRERPLRTVPANGELL